MPDLGPINDQAEGSARVIDLEPHIPGGIFEHAPAVGHLVKENEVPLDRSSSARVVCRKGCPSCRS